jgi:valyl-tRNA synthetase
VAIPLEGLIDFAQERQRFLKEQEKLRAESAKVEAQLANPNFVERAPAEKVSELRVRVAAIAQQMTQLQQTVENLQ